MTGAATQMGDAHIDVGMDAALRILSGFGADAVKDISDYGACLVQKLARQPQLQHDRHNDPASQAQSRAFALSVRAR
jgi:hypothetical protein